MAKVFEHSVIRLAIAGAICFVRGGFPFATSWGTRKLTLRARPSRLELPHYSLWPPSTKTLIR